MNDTLEQKLKSLPDKPGVYLYKSAAGRVIYVGKARNLKHRVRSYFQSGKGHSSRTSALVENIRDLEILVVNTEIDALILEGNLIKKHKPRYNVLLKDDKSFPYLLLTDEEYPRLVITRKPHQGEGRYFGPYVHAGPMRQTLRLIHRHLGIRQCDIEIDRKRPRPCLYYDLHQCDAPCVKWGETKEAYATHVKEARLLLEGREEGLMAEISQKMERASAEDRFEDAARLRDSMKALEFVRQRQRVVMAEPKDVDVIALAAAPDEHHVVQVCFIRGGKLIDTQSCRLKNDEGASEAEMLASFLPQFYAGGAYVPEEIVLSHEIELDGLPDWLDRKRGDKVTLSFPQRGEKRDWIRMVEENARQMMKEQWRGEADDAGSAGAKAAARDIGGGLDELMRVFGLKKPPARIEGFDISHIQGSHTVASMVVLLNGRPKNSEYRLFKIKTVQGVDDFASMQEVVGRRYKRLLAESKPLPDLVLIDGGKGQLSAALKALDGLGLAASLPCFGLAKRLEEIFVPGQEKSIRLDERSPGRLMIQRLRDEAHRFAISFHRKLRAKAIRHSALDDVKGVGPKLKQALIARFGSVEGVKAAGDAALREIKGVNEKVLQAIRETLA
jgi:excinuclease ABC subunit C